MPATALFNIEDLRARFESAEQERVHGRTAVAVETRRLLIQEIELLFTQLGSGNYSTQLNQLYRQCRHMLAVDLRVLSGGSNLATSVSILRDLLKDESLDEAICAHLRRDLADSLRKQGELEAAEAEIDLSCDILVRLATHGQADWAEAGASMGFKSRIAFQRDLKRLGYCYSVMAMQFFERGSNPEMWLYHAIWHARLLVHTGEYDMAQVVCDDWLKRILQQRLGKEIHAERLRAIVTNRSDPEAMEAAIGKVEETATK